MPRPSAAETQSTFLTTHRGTLPSSCVTWQADTDWALGDGARQLHRWPPTWLRALKLLHGTGDINVARRGRVKRSQEIELRQNSQMDTKGARDNQEEKQRKTANGRRFKRATGCEALTLRVKCLHPFINPACLPSSPLPHPFLYVTDLSLLFCSSTCFLTRPYIAVGVPASLSAPQLHLSYKYPSVTNMALWWRGGGVFRMNLNFVKVSLEVSCSISP